MRIPKSIKIGVHQYEVTSLPKKLERDRNGDCSDDKLLIRIGRAKLSKRQETLVHETIHPMFDGAPIDWDDIDEERIVTMLAPKILQLIRDNPELIQYLTS